MREALKTVFAGCLLVGGALFIGALVVFDYFTDPRPYPMGRLGKRK